MTDAALQFFDFGADIAIENGDLVADNGLANAVLISLFTDARAPDESELPAGETSKRGWWGEIGQFVLGSLLWLCSREKVRNEVAERHREFAERALVWLVNEDIAESVTVTPQLVRPIGLQLKIAITRGTSKQYAYLWDAVAEYSETVVQNTSIKLQFIQ